MNKFEKLVGNNGDDVLARRASNTAKITKLAQEALINELDTAIASKNQELIKLTDLAPINRDSLTPNIPEIGEKNWVEQVQKIKLDLYKLNISRSIAIETNAEYFSDTDAVAETGKKEKSTTKK